MYFEISDSILVFASEHSLIDFVSFGDVFEVPNRFVHECDKAFVFFHARFGLSFKLDKLHSIRSFLQECSWHIEGDLKLKLLMILKIEVIIYHRARSQSLKNSEHAIVYSILIPSIKLGV